MQIFFGELQINDLDSMLVPPTAWLLLAGYSDPQHAGQAATNYIVNIKGLKSDTPVAVTGVSTTIGTQPAIVMSDINASGGLEQHLDGAAAPKVAVKVGSSRLPRKRRMVAGSKSR
jgi:hypothetical protein